MTRRKLVHPELFLDENNLKNIESLKEIFSDLENGELLINIKDEVASLITIDSANTVYRFMDEKSVKNAIDDLKLDDSIFEDFIKKEELIANVNSAFTYTDEKFNETEAKLFNLKNDIDIISADTRLTSLEADQHKHDNMAILSNITESKVSAWDNAEQNAKDYASGLSVNYDVAGAAASALTEAKKYVDIISADTRLLSLEAINHNELIISAVSIVVSGAPEAFDTLKEIADWIAEGSGTTAANIVADIENLKGSIVSADTRLTSLEADQHKHDNMTILNGITESKVSAWDDAEQNAKDYATGTAASALTEAKDYVDKKIKEISEIGVTPNLDGYATSADVMTTTQIPVKGGIWADEIFSVFGENIPSGLTFSEFLQKMVFIEKFANNINTETVLTVTCNAPNPGINFTSGTKCEIGTEVVLKKTTLKDTNVSHYIVTSGLEYGYKLTETGNHNSSTSYTQNLDAIEKDSNTMLKAIFSGFTDSAATVVKTQTGTTSIDSMNIYVGEEVNKIIIYQTGKTFVSNTLASVDNIYVATNMGEYYTENDKTKMNIYKPNIEYKEATAYSSTSYNIEGYRNTFYGTTNGGENITVDFIRGNALNKTNKTIKSGDTITLNTFKANGHKRMIIASPIQIKSVKKDGSPEDITNLLNKTTLKIPGANYYSYITYYIYDYTWVTSIDGTWTITF